MVKQILLLVLGVFLSGLAYSQTKESADFTQGMKLYNDSKFKEAIPLFEKSLKQFHTGDITDSLGLANCYNFIGICHFNNADYSAALDNYYISRDLYSNVNSLSNTIIVQKNITLAYNKAREKNLVVRPANFDSTDAGDIYYSITNIISLSKDSAIVTIDEGKQDGLYPGSTGNIISSYAVGNVPNRDVNMFLGTARIIELKDYSARVVVYFYKKYTGVQIFQKDLLTLKTYPVIGAQKGFFSEMAKMNVLFLDNDRLEIISRREILLNTDPDLENILLKIYTKEITGFYEKIKGYDTLPNFTAPSTKGRFKGYSLIESFKITSAFDLGSFFNFVKSYPARYMGTSWKINETYATWVLNEAQQGEKNRAWLLPIIENANYADLDQLVQNAGYYIANDTLQIWNSRLTELQTGNHAEEAEQLCDKLIYIARKLKNSGAENEFYYSRSFIDDVQGRKMQAIEDARRAYRSDTTSINYMYGLASFYGKSEKFDSCFALYEKLLKLLPGNVNVEGNYGWYKITAGQFQQAIPLCRAAYFGAPGSVAFSVNYGHTFLLNGNSDSAKYYYGKMLNNLYSPADYYDGPKRDFELFFTKGWQRKNVGEVADWIDGLFNEKYYAITQGNLVWDEAKKYFNSNKYMHAVITWRKYISLFDNVKEQPHASIHNAYNWMGVSFEDLGKYDSAIMYYEIANQIAFQYLVAERNQYTTSDNDLIVNDYKRVYNYYVTTKNDVKAQEYKALYEAEKNKVNEMFTNPRLHLISLGGNSDATAINYKPGAKLIFDNLGKISKMPDSSNKNKLLAGESLTKDKFLSSIEQVRVNSRPEDIFIFYYSGITVNDKGGTYISFNPKDSVNGRISLNELMNSIDLVYAQKKMIIMDNPNPVLLSVIASKYTSAVNSSSEIIFACPGIETPVQKNNCSLFTNELVNTLNDLQKKGKFSAKDFIDQASYTIGRGQYYLPVLSFTSGKDFLVYEKKNITDDSSTATATTRGVKLPNNNQDNAETNQGGPQKNYALIFATDNYSEWGKLSNPIYDATAISGMLSDEFDFSTELIQNPTLAEIKNKLKEYWDKNFGPNDQLFIFFAGHGYYYEKAKMGYLVSKDSKMNDPNKDTYLSYSDLGNIYLKNITCKRIFLVLDACFAGSFFDQVSFRGTPMEIGAEKLDMLKRTAANKAFYKGISSGGKQYVEDGKPGRHSPFADEFISTLHNIPLRKSFVTADEIIGELKSNPPGATAICEGNFQYSDPFSHFIFEAKSTEKPSTIKDMELKKQLYKH